MAFTLLWTAKSKRISVRQRRLPSSRKPREVLYTIRRLAVRIEDPAISAEIL